MKILYQNMSPSEYGRRVALGVAKYCGRFPELELIIPGQPGFLPMVDHFAVDGVIGMFSDQSEITRWQDLGIPVINVSSAGRSGTGRVTVDNYAIGQEAAYYFLEKGIKQFGFFNTAYGESVYVTERRAGFIETLANHGFPVACWEGDSQAETHPAGWYETIAQMGTWLALNGPIGLFCSVDSAARIALLAMEKAGVEVPMQVAILGVDNQELICHSTSIALSSIEQGEDRVGYAAARMLHELWVDGRAPVDELVYPIGVVERQSTALEGINDPLVLSALAILGANLGKEGLLDFTAQKMGMSRRRLEQLFKQQLSMTPGKLINRLRAREAMRLLSDEQLTVEAVALSVGYKTRERLYEVFKRLGLPAPGKWREWTQ
jgi:LacI family transcriptional regulator